MDAAMARSKDPRDAAKAAAMRIKQTKEFMLQEGLEISDETAVLLMIHEDILVSEVLTAGPRLAGIGAAISQVVDALRGLKK